ncbi:MAG: nucleotidyltransferase domain-containing protein [Pseudomonadota bacterium]
MTEPAVSSDMQAEIAQRLAMVAQEEEILILLAVESGSRAWGFHSTDSDYDVRFIYARPIAWHLGLGKKRDVVERPIDDELDLSGWDLGKALTLAMGSNAVVAEWLQSPIVYAQHPGAQEDLATFAQKVLTRRPVMWHYLSLAKRQQERMIQPDGTYRLKRFFYTLRPALALRWIRLNDAPMPPMDMSRLMDGCELEPDLDAAIIDLIALKKAVREQSQGGAIEPRLFDFVDAELTTAKAYLAQPQARDEASKPLEDANLLNLKYARLAGS